MISHIRKLVSTILIGALGFGALSTQVNADELNVYSARKEALIKPALDKFSQQTGVKVNLVTGKADALISRMRSEGQFSPADVLITTDVGRLERAKTMGLTQTHGLNDVLSNQSTHLLDPAEHWVALTLRARPIMYATDRVNPTELSTMAALADPKWKGRICVRSSTNVYNQSMVSAMLATDSEQDVEQWAKGLVANFARPPKGGDRDQIKAVAAGQCDIAIANTYYLAGMLHSDDNNEVEAASKVSVFWPDQDGAGAHVNISGIVIAKHAKNVENAKQLVQYMLTESAQQWYAQTNHEYPVLDSVEASQTLKEMGEFKPQNVSLTTVGTNNDRALKLMDKAGWR